MTESTMSPAEIAAAHESAALGFLGEIAGGANARTLSMCFCGRTGWDLGPREVRAVMARLERKGSVRRAPQLTERWVSWVLA